MTFVFVGGNLALDLLGTRKWRRTTNEECLGSPADAARWAVASAMLTSEPSFSATDLAALLRLREAIYRLFRAVMAGDPPAAADLRLVNAAAARPGAAVELTPAGATRVGDATAVAAEVARAAAGLLGEIYAGGGPRLRECERPACTRLFVDRSRGGTRAWCGMAECGNRVKAADYRARKAAARH
ncbi:ABATE domain-containing protein [Actinoplanes sp. NPDC026670]|uniref:CGNR zinc finger domain-containing protein n=1 Tax=Actinoplanes sp. NPDC026670 TaxID=3154700 RepID=UPI0033F4B21E